MIIAGFLQMKYNSECQLNFNLESKTLDTLHRKGELITSNGEIFSDCKDQLNILMFIYLISIFYGCSNKNFLDSAKSFSEWVN